MDIYRILEKLDAVRGKKTLAESQHMAEPVAEGRFKELDMILQDHPEAVEEFKQTGELSTELYQALFPFYEDQMDYGTAKARTGDPYNFIADRLADALGLDEAYEKLPTDQLGLDKFSQAALAGGQRKRDALANPERARMLAKKSAQQPVKEVIMTTVKKGDHVSVEGKPAVIVGQLPTQAGMAKYFAVRFDDTQYPGNTYDVVHANKLFPANMSEDDVEEGNEFSGELAKAKAAGAKEFKVDGKTYPVKEAKGSKPDFLDLDKDGDKKEPMKKATKDKHDAKGSFQKQMGGSAKELTKGLSIKESELDEVFPGTPEYELRFGKPDSASAFDKKKISTGTVYSRRYQDEPETDDDAPKKAGRPKGKDKGPERVTKAAWKHKDGRKVKEDHNIDIRDQGEYDREGDMAQQQLHTVVDAARELHAILASDENLPEWVQSKITKALDYIDTARDYVKSSHAEREEGVAEASYSAKAARAGKDIGKPGKNFEKIAKDAAERYGSKERGEKVAGAVLAKLRAKEGVESVEEKAPPGAKAERMVKHIKSGYAKDGKLTDREKAIAYATAWKAKKAGKVEEESTDKEDQHAEKAGKKVTKDLEYDMKHKGKDDAKAEKAGKRVTKDIEYDDNKDKKKEVEETTVAGSVATAPAAASKAKGSMQFGKGVYEGQVAESFEQKLGSILNEGMSVNVSTDDTGKKSISVNATDADADALGDMLKMAGLFSSEGYSRACTDCGGIHETGACGADMVEETELANSPSAENGGQGPGYADTEYMTQTLSGGLNGPKTTGQTTGPIVNRQASRQGVMGKVDEVKEAAESRLWSLYKQIDKK